MPITPGCEPDGLGTTTPARPAFDNWTSTTSSAELVNAVNRRPAARIRVNAGITQGEQQSLHCVADGLYPTGGDAAACPRGSYLQDGPLGGAERHHGGEPLWPQRGIAMTIGHQLKHFLNRLLGRRAFHRTRAGNNVEMSLI